MKLTTIVHIRMFCRTCSAHFEIHDPGAVHGHMKPECIVEFQG